MPNLANITVKDSSNADVEFIGKSAAAGDGSYAQWLTNGPTPLTSSSFRVKAAYNGKKDGRRVEMNGAIPYLDETNKVVALQPFSFTTTVPQNIPAAKATDNSAVICNLVASTLVKAMVASGYSAT